VKVRRLDFVMVGEDQKVVSKTAVVAGENEKVVGKTAMVVESPAGKERFQDIIAIQEVLQKVVEHTDEQKWLLDEMKKDPRRIADLFVEGIKLATSKMEAGMTGQSAGSEALLKSIQILGDVLVTGEASTPPEDRADLERFIIILEEEIRQCSVQLISSKVAAGLLTEIIKAITSYADQVRAHKIAEEFLRGDKSIKKVGRLLRDLTPATESVENLVSRIRKYLLERGLTEDDLARLEQTIKTAHKPKPPRKLRKRSSEAIARGIAERLKDLNLEPALLEEIIARLCKFIEDVVREKAGELRLDIETLRSQLASHENVLHDLPGGVVLWNAEGKVEFLSHAAAKALGSETGVELGATLKARLCEWNFPLSTPAPPSTELSAAEIQLLRSVSFVFKDKTGGIHGVLINV
jgi:PAS domain-containing protein